jgi:DNA segregation ATPase FtsK/SpoIIIE, S-DNA-T family
MATVLSRLPTAATTRVVVGSLAVRVRAGLVVVARQVANGLVIWWRSILVLIMIMRLGVVWTVFCERTTIATRKTLGRGEHARTVVQGVPGLSHWRATQHGGTVRLALCPGQDLSTMAAATAPLRHSLRIQSAKVAEIDGHPGYLRLSLLRRDPLDRVRTTPRPVGPDRFDCGLTEFGTSYVVDFAQEPHILVTGATGSGKSGWLLALLCAVAPTDNVLVYWDLKFGLEAQVCHPRLSVVAENRNEVRDTAATLLHIAESRASLLKRLNCRSVVELGDRHGVQLRRVRLVVDEVAELALDSAAELEDDATAKVVLTQTLRLVQLVRAMGINIVLCGQRFGSDMGKLITSIRAQLSGRVCLRVNDRQTVEMTLPGFDSEVHARVMSLSRPGLAVVASGADWYLARPPWQSFDAARAVAMRHADKAISLHDLEADDHARVAHLLKSITDI